MITGKVFNETQIITTMEAVAWMRKIRLREEAAGRDPMQCEEYLLARSVSADCAGRDIDVWKQRVYASAERDEGRYE